MPDLPDRALRKPTLGRLQTIIDRTLLFGLPPRKLQLPRKVTGLARHSCGA